MAATITKAGSPGPITDRIALGATAGNVTRITFPRWAREITIRIFASDNTTASAGFVSATGTDGAAYDADAVRIESGIPYMLNPPPGAPAVVLYVAGASSDDVAHVSVGA
jgi:hypothetical protein